MDAVCRGFCKCSIHFTFIYYKLGMVPQKTIEDQYD